MPFQVTTSRAHAARRSSRTDVSQLKPSRSDPSAGFSLVELMVTVALVGLILVLFATYTSSSSFRLQAAANSLYAAFQKTRMEAIMRNRNVSLSFDLNGDGVADDQMTVWVDENNNNTYDGTTELVEVVPREEHMALGSVSTDDGGPPQPPPACSSFPPGGIDFNNAANAKCALFAPDGTASSGVVILHNLNNPSTGTYAIVMSSVGNPRLWYYQPGTSGWKDR